MSFQGLAEQLEHGLGAWLASPRTLVEALTRICDRVRPAVSLAAKSASRMIDWAAVAFSTATPRLRWSHRRCWTGRRPGGRERTHLCDGGSDDLLCLLGVARDDVLSLPGGEAVQIADGDVAERT